MDPQSIITQVSPEERPLNSTPTTTDKVVQKKKQRSRGLFCHLLCCFRPPVVQQPSPVQSEENGINRLNESSTQSEVFLLRPVEQRDSNKKCVVIDLDETLVHSSFQPINNADFVIPVEIDNTIHQVYVLKRPHVDEFLQTMGQLFECVLFTASLGKYADPVTDLLDKWGVFRARLFREACVFHRGNYVKDLSRLGRDLNRVVIVDNSPMSYMFHPRNAVPVVSWFDDANDRELLDLIPFFKRLAEAEDIFAFLSNERLPLGHPDNIAAAQVNEGPALTS